MGGSYPLQLLRNDLPEGRFTDIAASAGLSNGYWAKGIAWGDYDGDGDPDLYVSNIGPNRLFRNNGDGTFTDVAAQLGVTEPAERSFATWFFDYDNDGDPRLYRNDGPRAGGGQQFTEVSSELGLTAPSLPMGANFGDLDNDGFLDIYLGTGLPVYEALTPNLMYRNDQGRRFQDVTFSGHFGHLQKGHGIAFGDLDNDGDQDVFEQMGGAFPGDAYHSVLYQNPGHGHAWLQLRLTGTQANRSGQGSQIHLEIKDAQGQTQHLYRTVGTGGSFGGSPLRVELGLGNAKAIQRLEIRWPGSPKPQIVQGLELNKRYEIRQNDPKPHPFELQTLQLGGGMAGHGQGGG